MSYRIFIFVFCLGLVTACVSPKIVEEMKAEQNDLKSYNKSLKQENLQLNTQNIELGDQVNRLNQSVLALVADSSSRSNKLIHLQAAHQELNSAYDLLIDKNSQFMANKAKETKKLLAELQKTQEDLQIKEDELMTLEGSLTKNKNSCYILKKSYKKGSKKWLS